MVTGDWFRSNATSKVFKIGKSHTCTSANVVYLAQCVDCGLQGVGSSQTTNHTLSKNHRTCGIVNHFLDCHDADHSSLKFILSLHLEKVKIFGLEF